MNSFTTVFDALKSRYRILSRPPSDAERLDNDEGYLRQLWVFGNRVLDDDHGQQHSPPTDSTSMLMFDLNIIDIDQRMVNEKIISALSALRFQGQHVLVQFWSPDSVQKRCSLTTLDQPFSLGVVHDKGLYSYRLDSEQRMFAVDEKHREELGPPARAYRQKMSVWSFDSQTLPTRQSVQDLAAYYNIFGYLLLPVFEPDSGCCVGVLELVTSSSNFVNYDFMVQEASRALKEQNLKSPDVFKDSTINEQKLTLRRKRRRSEISISLEEIRKHMGKTMGEAAAVLNISRSMLKRVCRNYGIQRWPHRNLPTLPSPIPSLTLEEVIPPESGNRQLLVENERNNKMKKGEFPYFHVGIEDYDISVGLEEIMESEKMVKEIKDMIDATRSKIKHVQESPGIPMMPEEDAEPEITVKATYIDNMVRFPFRLSEGFVKLEESVAMRFQLRLASFKLKYRDVDDDMILISCDHDLMNSMHEFIQRDGRTVIRLWVTLCD